MSQWLSSHNYSHQTQLIGAAIIGGLAAVTTIYSIQAIRGDVAVEDLKASKPQLTDKRKTQRVRSVKLWSTQIADWILSSSMNSVLLSCRT